MPTKAFSWSNIFIRFIFALILVMATYNPSTYSYTHWVLIHLPESLGAVSVFAGIVLLIGWIVYLNAAWNSLGPIGLVLATAFFAAFIWLLIDTGLLAADNVTVMNWIILLVLSAVLAIGMSWSHIWRRMSGQIDIDDVED